MGTTVTQNRQYYSAQPPLQTPVLIISTIQASEAQLSASLALYSRNKRQLQVRTVKVVGCDPADAGDEHYFKEEHRTVQVREKTNQSTA